MKLHLIGKKHIAIRVPTQEIYNLVITKLIELGCSWYGSTEDTLECYWVHHLENSFIAISPAKKLAVGGWYRLTDKEKKSYILCDYRSLIRRDWLTRGNDPIRRIITRNREE